VKVKMFVAAVIIGETLSIGVGVAFASHLPTLSCREVNQHARVVALDCSNIETNIGPEEVNVKKHDTKYYPRPSRYVVSGSSFIARLSWQVESLINWAAQKVGLSPGLLSAVARAESGGNQVAVSTKGAIGVMQLMPGTAAGLGVNPYDLRENVLGGAMYLKRQLDRYQGDIPKALAAYNAGPGIVDRYNEVPPYGETKTFINRVLSMFRGDIR